MKRPFSAFLATHRSIVLTLGVFLGLAIFGVITWSVSAGNRAKPPEKTLEQEPTAAQTGKEKKAGAPRISDDPTMIMLNAGAIDTAKAQSKAERVAAKFGGKQMRLVKFSGPIQPEWYSSLTKAGLEIIDYIPSYSYLVYGDSQSLSRVGRSVSQPESGVSWYGDYTPAMRIHPTVYSDTMSTDASEVRFYKIQLYKDDAANTATLNEIESIQTAKPKKEAYSYLHYVVATVGLTLDGVEEISKRPDVVSIYPYITPVRLDERQDMIMAGNLTGNAPTPGDYLAYLTGKGFSTTTATFGVNISDSGVDNGTTTPNFFGLYALGNPTAPVNSRVVYTRVVGTPTGPASTTQACDGHGNLNTSIICGYVPTGTVGGVNFGAAPHADASGFRYGLGIFPYVKVGSSVIFDNSGAAGGDFTSPNYTTLESSAYNDSMRVSSNSWGASSNAYTVDAQEYDALVRDAQPTGAAFPAAGNQEYTILFAAGNDGAGAGSVGEPGTAKNIITVGASENVQAFGGADACGIGDTGADSANDIISFSGRGPTSDGRTKPDIVGPGTHVSGSVGQASIASPTGSGTGAQIACFNASGVCGGVGIDFFPSGGQQWYTASSGTSHSTPAMAGYAALIRQHFINQALTPPSPALTKALMLNSARYMNGVGANDNLFSNNQGMGEANFNSFFDIFASAHAFHDQVGAEMFTASGQQKVITASVASAAKPVRLTLVWTDAPGATSGNAFVNNLDLEVTAGGNTYKGNVFSGANSATGGNADTRNNVESVVIPAGVTGNVVIKVKATNIAGNGVPNNASALDQDFALVEYNLTEGNLPVPQTGTAVVTAESCAPANAAVDPGETVTVDFPLSNVGTANTTALTATLLAGGGVSSPSGPQNYGAVTAGGGAVSRPFTFTATSSCGQTLSATFHLQDGALDLGNVTFNMQVGALGPPVAAGYSTGNIAVAIVDSGTVDIPITVAQTGAVADMNVKVRLNHTFDDDVVLTLIAPDGTPVVLSANHDTALGGGDNYGSGTNDCSGTPTIFDDAAATAIGAGLPPFAGTFRPDEALSAFNGKTLAGIWKLRVTDTAAQDVGTVGCVSLDVQRQAYACCGVVGTPIPQSGGPDVIIGESLLPHNNAPDPGERITITVPIINGGDGPTSNLTATLQNTGGVTLASSPQNYGAVPTGGAPVSRTFAFTASGVCGGNLTLSFQLQDGVTNYGTITYTTQLGTTNASTQSFSNTTPIVVPGTGTGATTGAPASPYPSNITVAGITAPVTKVTISLNNISHTFPDDVDVLLVGPTGRKFIPISDAGDTNDWVGATITLDDSSATSLGDTASNQTGTFKPGNFGTIQDPFPAPAPVGPYLSPAPGGAETFATAFNGQDPNGTWSLYVVDDAATDVGTFAGGWTLSITSSAPVCATLLAAGVDVSGSVMTSDGRGLTNAVVTITDSEGAVQTAITGRNGFFTFADVGAGKTYIVNVASKRFQFVPQVLQVNDSVSGILFTPLE